MRMWQEGLEQRSAQCLQRFHGHRLLGCNRGRTRREVKLDLNLIGEGGPDAPGIFSPAILPGNGLYSPLYRITLGASSERPEIQLPSFRRPRKNYLTSS